MGKLEMKERTAQLTYDWKKVRKKERERERES